MAEEELSIEELRKRGRVTQGDSIPGNILYPGFGRPCPDCKCFFTSSYDYHLHRQPGVCQGKGTWRKSKFDNGEICPSEEDLTLKLEILKSGSIHMANWTYSLSQDGKWLKRKPAPA